MSNQSARYVPGYRLEQAVQFERIGGKKPRRIPELGGEFSGLKVSGQAPA